MIVITLTACPPALRGDLTKWLQEINTGVYVGQVSARVRNELWQRVKENAKDGRATMVFSAQNEQRLDFRVHNTSWEPINFDGLKLMLRPSPARVQQLSELRVGYSNAARMRKAKQMAKKGLKVQLQTYLVLDIETTGASVVEDEIIEIGAIVVREGIIDKKYHSLVKSSKKIQASIESLTGITDQMIEKGGKDLSEVLSGFLEFAGDLLVVSCNVELDYGFLRAACKRFGLPLFSNQCIDTLVLARRLVDDVNNYKLETLLDYFQIEAKGSQRGIEGCLATKQLYEKLIKFEQKQV